MEFTLICFVGVHALFMPVYPILYYEVAGSLSFVFKSYYYYYRDDSFKLFNWFQLFSSENCFLKVAGHDQTIMKGDRDGFSYFSLISVVIFSNQVHPCYYIRIMKMFHQMIFFSVVWLVDQHSLFRVEVTSYNSC